VVTKAEVEMAYRLILGREPEDDAVVAAHAVPDRTLAQLRQDFLAGAEFSAKFGRTAAAEDATGFKPLIWEKIDVAADVGEHQLRRMLERIEKEFLYLGKTEPHWSIISREDFKVANMAGKEDEFFHSGKGVVDDFMIAADRCGIDLGFCRTCFELGCGLGRSTIWLAERFPEVVGADISAAHLQQAEAAMRRFNRANVKLVHINSIASLAGMDGFDAFFSIIVLQHNPPPVIAAMLETVLQKLRPGGVAYFQVPTYNLGYSFDPEIYLANEQPPGVPEMHLLPQPILFRLIEEAGCKLVEIREDGAAGAFAISNRLLVRKPSAGVRPAS
jgi:SAM-dependent methyltransferase